MLTESYLGKQKHSHPAFRAGAEAQVETRPRSQRWTYHSCQIREHAEIAKQRTPRRGLLPVRPRWRVFSPGSHHDASQRGDLVSETKAVLLLRAGPFRVFSSAPAFWSGGGRGSEFSQEFAVQCGLCFYEILAMGTGQTPRRDREMTLLRSGVHWLWVRGHARAG